MKYFKYLLVGLLVLGMSISGFAQARRNAGAAVPAERDTVRFRCAYLDASQQSDEKLFVKERKGFRLLNLGVMAFLGEYSYSGALPVPIFRKATPEEIEQRKKDPLVPKAEVEYVRVYELDPHGMNYFGAILLPSPSGKAFEKPLIFDLNPKAFPPGAVRIYNFSRRTVGVKYEVQGEPKTQSALTIRHQDSAITPATTSDSGMFELRAFVKLEKTQPLQEVFRTVGVVQKKHRYCAFLLPDSRETKRNGGNVALTCRTIKIVPLAPPSQEQDDAEQQSQPKRRSSR